MDNKTLELQNSFLDLCKFLQQLTPGQLKAICQFVNPNAAFDLDFQLLSEWIRKSSFEQLQQLISLAAKRFYLQENYNIEATNNAHTKILPHDYQSEIEHFIQLYHIHALSRLLRDLSRQQLILLFDIVPNNIFQMEQLQLLQQIQQLLVQLHPETLRELRDELAESPGKEIQQLISMNILKTEHFNLYRTLAMILTLDVAELLSFQQVMPKLEPLQLIQLTKLIEVGPFEAINLHNLFSVPPSTPQPVPVNSASLYNIILFQLCDSF
jgi:hypothetical protein